MARALPARVDLEARPSVIPESARAASTAAESLELEPVQRVAAQAY